MLKQYVPYFIVAILAWFTCKAISSTFIAIRDTIKKHRAMKDEEMSNLIMESIDYYLDRGYDVDTVHEFIEIWRRLNG